LIVGFMQRTGAVTEAQIANLRQTSQLPAEVPGEAPETPAKPAPATSKAAPAKPAVRKR